jgi:hypothetical protein
MLAETGTTISNASVTSSRQIADPSKEHEFNFNLGNWTADERTRQALEL